MNRHALSCAVKARARGALSGHLPLVVAANLTFSAVFLLLYLAGAQMNFGNGIPGFVFSVILSWSLDVFFGLFFYGLQGIYLGLAYCRPVQQKDLFAGFSENTRQILLMQIFPVTLKLAAMLPAFWAAFFLPLHTEKSRIIFAVLFAIGICLRLWIRLTYALSFFLLLDFPREGAVASLSALSCSGPLHVRHRAAVGQCLYAVGTRLLLQGAAYGEDGFPGLILS